MWLIIGHAGQNKPNINKILKRTTHKERKGKRKRKKKERRKEEKKRKEKKE